ncbi:MAG TPA: hypothetical protein VGG17_00740, partial [Acidimicrobiales bacterium]
MSAMVATKRAVRRDVLLGLAVVWAALVLVILTHYHVREPGSVKSITTNGHTYYGDPPALTLLESDPVSFVVITIAMGLGVVVGIVDLVVGKIRVRSGWGRGAVIAGVGMVLFSLFGLLFGPATVGVDGAL